MSAALIVYLIGLLDSFNILLTAWFVVVSSVVIGVAFISFVESNITIAMFCSKFHKTTKAIIISWFASIILITIIPSKSEMYVIVGLHVGEQIINSDKGSVILDKSYEAILSELNNVIEKNTKEKE